MAGATCIKGVVAGAGNGSKVRWLLMGKLPCFCRGKRTRCVWWQDGYG